MQCLRFSCLFLVLGAVSVSACASGRDEMEKRLSTMRKEISELQTQNDQLEERLGAVEMKQAKARASKASIHSDSTIERPRLKVIRLEPGEAKPAAPEPASSPNEVKPEESPDDPTPRPMIRLRGKKGDEASRRERPSEHRLSQNESADSRRDGE